jgi:hypothetical protein
MIRYVRASGRAGDLRFQFAAESCIARREAADAVRGAARGALPMRAVCASKARSFPPRAAMSEFSHDSVQIPRAYIQRETDREPREGEMQFCESGFASCPMPPPP